MMYLAHQNWWELDFQVPQNIALISIQGNLGGEKNLYVRGSFTGE